jgi:hypothetical protein
MGRYRRFLAIWQPLPGWGCRPWLSFGPGMHFINTVKNVINWLFWSAAWPGRVCFVEEARAVKYFL